MCSAWSGRSSGHGCWRSAPELRHHHQPSGRHRGRRRRDSAQPSTVLPASRKRWDRYPRFTLRVCHFEECDAAELASQQFDSVLCVNVLEHIADDVSALKAFEHHLWRRVVVSSSSYPRCRPPMVRWMPSSAIIAGTRNATLRAAFYRRGSRALVLRYTNPISASPGGPTTRTSANPRSTAWEQVRLFETLVAPWALPLERLRAAADRVVAGGGGAGVRE